MMPYVIFLKTIPVVAIAPLLVIWFGAGMLPKVFLAASVCFFPVLIGTLNGLKELDPSLHDVFRSMGATQWQIFWWLKAPNCLVFLFPTFKIAVVFAVIGSIVAEFASANAGLGFKILMASFHVDTPAMFAYIIACSLLSMSLYGTLALLEHLFIPWSFTLRKAIK
jgi:NitT/TauT family transport system permease protein